MHGNNALGKLAATLVRFRRVRSELLPAELFGEPAWDLLLHLFVADAEGRRVTGRRVCQQSTIPPTVMSRWLMHLAKVGLIVGDGSGDLDDELTLSGDAFHRMEHVLTQADALRTTLR